MESCSRADNPNIHHSPSHVRLHKPTGAGCVVLNGIGTMLSNLRTMAQTISMQSADGHVKQLAGIVASLVDECERLEKETKEAMAEARRAKREAKR